VQAMLQVDPMHRPTISEILGHSWMQGEIPTEEEVRLEFIKRENRVKEFLQGEAARKAQEKAANRNIHQGARRGVASEEEKGHEEVVAPKKTLDKYERVLA